MRDVVATTIRVDGGGLRTLEKKPLYRRIRAERRSDQGFTLIELLVVIIILGILAAVVVFAVSGVGDRGKAASVATDAKTIRTAEEAYCAQNGRYASGADLVAGGFLSEVPTYHQVDARFSGEGSCNGWQFSILREEAAGPYELGSWEPLVGSPMGFTWFTVRLADGRVLAGGFNSDFSGHRVAIWDPVSGDWSVQQVPPWDFADVSKSALLLQDDPTTARSECRGTVDNCGKVFVFGKYLFDSSEEIGNQWETLPLPQTAVLSNNGSRSFRWVQFRGTPDKCGDNCGKIALVISKPSICSPDPLLTGCNHMDIYDPTTNSYEASASYPDSVTRINVPRSAPMALSDGRIFFCCSGASPSTPTARFFDPKVLSLTTDPLPELIPINYTTAPFQTSIPTLPNGDFYLGYHGDNWDPALRPLGTGIYRPEAGGAGSWRAFHSCVPPEVTSEDAPPYCLTLGSLMDGRIVVARSSDFSSLNRGEPGDPFTGYWIKVFNPATEAWTDQPQLNDDRSYSSPPLLLDPAKGPCGEHCGKLLLVGNEGYAEFFIP